MMADATRAAQEQHGGRAQTRHNGRIMTRAAGLAAELEPAPALAHDRRHYSQRQVIRFQDGTLLDVGLQVALDLSRDISAAGNLRRVEAEIADRMFKRDTIRIDEAEQVGREGS